MSDDALDRQLREATPYIDDGGFTARVLAQLPATRRQPASVRGAILLGLATLGSVLAYILTDAGRFLLVNVVRLAVLPPAWVFAFTLAIGVLAVSGAVFAAMTKVRDLSA